MELGPRIREGPHHAESREVEIAAEALHAESIFVVVVVGGAGSG